MPVRHTGRPRGPVAPDSPPAVRELAVRLRELREASGLTLSKLAELGPTHMSLLSRASSGRIVPSWEIVKVFADAAQLEPGDVAALKRLWERARSERATRSTAVPETAGAGSVSTSAQTLLGHHQDFARSAALRDLYEEAGTPPLRQLAGESGHPRSTVHRAVTGQSLAGAADIAEALVLHLPESRRVFWEPEVKVLFGPPAAAPVPVAPPFEVAEGEAASQAHRAVADFKKALRELRNLIAHGGVKLSPQISAQVVLLQAAFDLADATVVVASASAGSGKTTPVARRAEAEEGV
ncbi:helix-turn-helix domain-containing protein [Streptomyces sp. NPDC005070]